MTKLKELGLSVLRQFKLFFLDASPDEPILKKNEAQANRLMGKSMLIVAVLILLTSVLYDLGILEEGKITDISSMVGLLFMLAGYLLTRFVKGNPSWLKYALMAMLTLSVATGDCLLGYNVTLELVLPVVISIRYASHRFTLQTAVFSMAEYTLSSFLNVYYGYGIQDLNFVKLPSAEATFEQLRAINVDSYMRLSLLPRLLIFSVVAISAQLIAGRVHEMLLEQADTVKKSARIESELSLASDIQANMLPNIFPPFPEHDEMDVYATMTPAKEVGGDFYDFFMIDDSHIATVIADVSGKGVPAALFMVVAKTLIKDHAQLGLTPAEVFTRVNRILCQGNDVGLFVTAWLGVLDLETGVLTYANAGHNPPLISKNGRYEYLQQKPGFVLAGLEELKYKQASFTMEPGDRLFLYTDGVTEASDANGTLYGEQRLKDYLNRNITADKKDVLTGLHADIDTFAGECEQADDITMLELDYTGAAGVKADICELDAVDDELANATAFLEESLEKHEVPMNTSMQLQLALEECFVNVAHYGYPGRTGRVKLEVSVDNNIVTVCVKDRGIPFDPLSRQDPDVTLSAEERSIGGLGIFLIKKTMDDVSYEYKDGMNVLTFKKKY